MVGYDHRQICRYKSSSSSGYLTVLGHIKKLAGGQFQFKFSIQATVGCTGRVIGLKNVLTRDMAHRSYCFEC